MKESLEEAMLRLLRESELKDMYNELPDEEVAEEDKVDTSMVDGIVDDVLVITDPDVSSEEYEEVIERAQEIVEDTPEGEIPFNEDYIGKYAQTCPVCGGTFVTDEILEPGATCPICLDTPEAFVMVGQLGTDEEVADEYTEVPVEAEKEKIKRPERNLGERPEVESEENEEKEPVEASEVVKTADNKLEEAKLEETTNKGFKAKKDDLNSRKRQALKDAGVKDWENLARSFKGLLPDDVIEQFRLEDEELNCISMLHSILTYSPKSSWNLDTVMSNRYMQKFIDALGEEKVKEIAQGEIDEYLNNAIIENDVYTDGEDVSYNSVTFKNESKKILEALSPDDFKRINDETVIDDGLQEIIDNCKKAYADRDIPTAGKYWEAMYDYIEKLFGVDNDDENETKYRALTDEDRTKMAALQFKAGDSFEDKLVYDVTDYLKHKYYRENGLEESKEMKTEDREDIEAKAKEIIANFDPKVVDANIRQDGASVAIKDKSSGLVFWIDMWQNRDDIEDDWNQYIFHLDNDNDVLRKIIQDSAEIYEACSDEAFTYLRDKGVIQDSDNSTGWKMVTTKQESKLQEDKPVTVYTYGKGETFNSRAEAIAKVKEWVYGSEGSEQERYVNVLMDLLDTDADKVYDYPEDYEQEECKLTEAPSKDSEEFAALCNEIDYQAFENKYDLSIADVEAIAKKLVADKFFFNHDIFADEDDEDAWGEINTLILNAIKEYSKPEMKTESLKVTFEETNIEDNIIDKEHTCPICDGELEEYDLEINPDDPESAKKYVVCHKCNKDGYSYYGVSAEKVTEAVDDVKYTCYFSEADLADANISSLLFDSNTVVARLEKGNYRISIIVNGDIKIINNENGDVYKSYSQYPDELINLIKNENLDDSEKYTISMDNWFEFFIDEKENGEWEEYTYDVADIEGTLNGDNKAEQLKQEMLEMLNAYIE